ncbi:MAG: hypothetical protein ABIH29_00285 [Candidatus Micrarchaeota archaeon]
MRSISIGLVFLVLSGSGFSQCLDACMNDCCFENGGLLAELLPGKVNECQQQSGCMLLFLGSIKGQDDIACLQYAGEQGSGFSREKIARCMGTCMNECGQYWSGSPSPFSDGSPPAEPPEEEEEPKGPCYGISCPSVCRYESSLPTFYYDGRCMEDNTTSEGYICGYTKGQCVWKCNSAGTNCEDADPLGVNIDEPADGQTYDPGSSGYALYPVSGSVSIREGYAVSRLMVTTTLGFSQQAQFNPDSGRFSLDEIRIDEGRPNYITATAYDSAGRRLGTDTITVYASPKLINLLFKKGHVTLWRTGEIIGSDWVEGFNEYKAKEGDTFEVSGTGSVTGIYSDGTTILLKGPFRIQFFKDAIHLHKGAVEVDVNKDFTVFGRLGEYLVKGTRFKVIVPENEGQPETLIVLEGTVESGLIVAPEDSADVGRGQHLYLYPGLSPTRESIDYASSAEMLSFEEGGEVTAPVTYGDTPAGEGGCVGAILIFSLAALLFFRRG